MSIASRIESMTEHLTNAWNNVDSLELHTKKLPKEYTQVDYIESHGEEYIDTGVNADNNLRVVLDFAYTSISLSNQNIGAIRLESGNNARYHILLGGSPTTNRTRVFVNDNGYWAIDDDTNRHLYDINPLIGQVLIDNTSYTIPSNIKDVGLNFWLFGRNSTSTIYLSRVKQWACQMYYENELVRDFIPCYRNSDNEVGLYDLVNDTFYTNQGTGAFTYGQIQEEHMDRNLENLKLPLNRFYNEVSDKTDISQNGVVGRTSQESTTGANIVPCLNIERTINGVTCTPQSDGTIILNGTATAQIVYPITNNSSTSTGHAISVEANSYKFILYGDTNVSNNTYFLQVGYYASDGKTAKFYNSINDTPLEIPTNQQIGVGLIIRQGQSFNNHIIKPMGVLSTYTGGFEPYTNGASPNPDYPQPINNLSDDVPYKVSGKNMFDKNSEDIGHVYSSTGSYDTSALWNTSDWIKASNYITISASTTGSMNILLSEFDNSKTFIQRTQQLGTLKTYNLNTNTKYVRLSYKNDIGITNIQIEQGSTATTYEPYIEPQTFDIPLKSKNVVLTNINDWESGQYNINGPKQDMASRIRLKDLLPIKPNTKYYFDTFDTTEFSLIHNFFIRECNKNGDFINNAGTINNQGTFTTRNDTYYLMVTIGTSNTTSGEIFENYQTYFNEGKIKPFICLDSEIDKSYEPYYDIELCNIDTYEDKIYSSNGRFYLNKNIKKHLFTTSDNIAKGGSSTDGYARCGWGSSSEIATSDFDKILVKCNKFLGMSQNNNGQSLTGEHWYCSLSNTDKYNIMFRCGDTEYTRDTFPEFIKNNEIIVYYPLKEPTTTEIAQENYPSLYNALKQIQDYLTAYKINKEFILGYSSPEIEY